MKRRYSLLMIAVISCSIFSCKNKNADKLDTALVNNPISADGSEASAELPNIKFDTTSFDFGIM